MALAAAVGIGRFAFTPILPMMQEDAGLTVSEGGWLASAHYAGYLLGALWAMVQRVRPDLAVRAALLATAAATAGMAFVDGLASWLVLRALAGVSSAWALIHVTSWCVERLTPLRRPIFNGTVFAGVGSGTILTGVLCLVLMVMEAGSRDAWLSLGLIALLITAAVWPVLGVNSEAKGSPIAPPYRWSFDGVRLVACYGAFGLGYIIPATFLPVMAKKIVTDPVVFGWAWPAFGAAAVLSTLFAAALMRALSNRRLWMLGSFVMALGVVSPVIVPGLAGIALSALLVGGTFMVTTMAGIQEARAVAGASASVLVAAMTAAFAAGQIAGPLIVSAFISGARGFSEALLLAFALLMASVVALAVPNKGATQ